MMIQRQTTQVELPKELAERLQSDAKAMGLDLPAYLEFLRSADTRQHNAKFKDAAKYTPTNYPDTMRKLAQ